MRLFTYCITNDTGAAPNPFWGICTLAICKPVIRRVAKVGDWVCATGSVEDGMENKVIYAMKITGKKTFRMYDVYCRKHCPNKIPDWSSTNLMKKVGDCIYYYEEGKPKIRKSVHDRSNMKTDLGGSYVLLSNEFYYFGSKAVDLPKNLQAIVKQGRAHKSKQNDRFKNDFVKWIEGNVKFKKYKNYSHEVSPLHFSEIHESDCRSKCSKRDKKSDIDDEKLGCD